MARAISFKAISPTAEAYNQASLESSTHMDSLKDLPPWVWVAVIGGSLLIGFVVLRGNSAAAQQPADTSTTQQQQPVVINLPQPEPTQPPTNTINLPQFYTVKSGDHTADILARFGISLEQLKTWNCPVYPLLCQGHLFAGWVLRVG